VLIRSFLSEKAWLIKAERIFVNQVVSNVEITNEKITFSKKVVFETNKV